MSVLYQNAYQKVSLPILESDGITSVDASTFAEAEYRIVNTGTCTVVYTASLAGQLTVISSNLQLEILENTLDITGTKSEYSHYLRVGTASGKLEAPVFDAVVDILPVCEIV
jgi:HSP20 family molecular chaperone IbpA